MSDCNHENYFMNENCYVCDLESEIQQLEARLKDAEKVIGFYAALENYNSSGFTWIANKEKTDTIQHETFYTLKGDWEIKSKYGICVGGKKAREYQQKYKNKKDGYGSN